jgi:hypothetical protein
LVYKQSDRPAPGAGKDQVVTNVHGARWKPESLPQVYDGKNTPANVDHAEHDLGRFREWQHGNRSLDPFHSREGQRILQVIQGEHHELGNLGGHPSSNFGVPPFLNESPLMFLGFRNYTTCLAFSGSLLMSLGGFTVWGQG